MPLRDFLENTAAMNQLTGGFAKSVSDMRKELELKKAIASLPQAIQEGDQGKLIQAQAIINPAGLDDLTRAAIAKANQPKPYDVSAVKTLFPGITDPQAQETAKAANREEQLKLGALFKNQQQLDETRRAQERLETKQDVTYKNDFSKPMEDFKNKVDESTQKVKGSLAQFKQQKNKATRQALAVGMARALGDSGVLSNTDIANYGLSTIDSTWQGVVAYVTSQPEGAISDSVVDALSKMAEGVIGQAEERKKEGLQARFKDQIAKYGDLMIKGDKRDPVLQNWEKDIGVKAQKSKSGGWELAMTPKEYPGKKAAAAAKIAKIQNEALRKSAYAKLDGVQSDQAVQQIETVADNLLKQGK